MLSYLSSVFKTPSKKSREVDSESEASPEVQGKKEGKAPYDELVCSLHLVEGVEAEEIFEQCKVTVEGDNLVFEDVSAGGDGDSKEIPVKKIFDFRLTSEDSYQFCVRMKDGCEEYGVMFEDESDAPRLRKLVQPLLLSTASVSLINARVGFGEFDTSTKQWVPISPDCIATVWQRPGDFEALLTVSSATGEPMYQERLTSNLQIHPSADRKGLNFIGNPGSAVRFYSITFIEEVADAFFTTIDTALFEMVHQKKWKAGDGYDSEMFADAESHQSETEGEEEEMEWEGETGSLPTSPVKTRDPARDALRHHADTKITRGARVGRERAFMFKQNASTISEDKGEIAVYNTTGLEHVGDIKYKKFTYQNQELLPSEKSLFYQGEDKLVMLSADSKNSAFLFDVNRETVVQKFDAGEGMPITNLTENAYNAHLQQDATFLGSNSQAIFRMDPRLGGGRGGKDTSVRAETMQYTSKVQLLCSATTETGGIVVGSKLGELRLYDGEANRDGGLKRAKTSLSATATAIKHVDVSKDGKWILATTDREILVVPTSIPGSSKTGFTAAMGQQKQKPIKLRILDQHIRDNPDLAKPSMVFTAAHFTYGPDGEETGITSSMSNIAFIWDFKAVKRGNASKYKMHIAQEWIREVQVIPNKDNVVLAMNSDAAIVNAHKVVRASMRAPNN